MTDNAGGCALCGATYRRKDFGTDGDGRLILTHVCLRRQDYRPELTAEAIQSRKERRLRSLKLRRVAWLAEAREHRCIDCPSPATKYSDRCRLCQRSAKIRTALAKRLAS